MTAASICWNSKLQICHCKEYSTFYRLGHSRPLFFTFVFSIQSTVSKICQRLDTNHTLCGVGSAALPTEPQPLTNVHNQLPSGPVNAVSW